VRADRLAIGKVLGLLELAHRIAQVRHQPGQRGIVVGGTEIALRRLAHGEQRHRGEIEHQVELGGLGALDRHAVGGAQALHREREVAEEAFEMLDAAGPRRMAPGHRRQLIEHRHLQARRKLLGHAARSRRLPAGDHQQVAARDVAHARHRIRRREVEQGGERGDLGAALVRRRGPTPAFQRQRIVPEIVPGNAIRGARGRGYLRSCRHAVDVSAQLHRGSAPLVSVPRRGGPMALCALFWCSLYQNKYPALTPFG
jgi:hypothetical protein